jgi:ornithine cyclodeaminase/alanine dehydrogenase-like protein (mu-crystallin family)
MRPGTYCGLVLLFSTQNGEPLAIINDGHLQHMRVGASAAIGARLLAREDAHVVGMIGSGGMARTALEALAEVREIKMVKVYSRIAANRETFAKEMTDHLNVAIEPARGRPRHRHPGDLHGQHVPGDRRRLDRTRHACREYRPA